MGQAASMLLANGRRNDESGEFSTYDFVLSVAECPLGSGIKLEYLSFLVDGNNAIQRTADESCFALLAGTKRFCGTLLPANVAGDFRCADYFIVNILDWRNG